MVTDALEPLLLLVGELPSFGELAEGCSDALLGGEQWSLVMDRMLDHRDDVYERLVVLDLVCPLQAVFGEALRRGAECPPQLPQRIGTPLLRTVEQNADGLHL